MAWLDELRDASFRGVPCFMDGTSDTAGRRTIVHEFPLRPLPQVEDLDASAKRFRCDVFLIGDDVFSQRDAFEKALNQGGPGRLVHPWRGEFDVAVEGDYTTTHSTREGGYVAISVTFVRTTDTVYPQAATDTATTAKDQASATRTAATDAAAKAYSIKDAADWVVREAQATTNQITSAIDACTQYITTLPAEAAALAADLSRVSSSVASLVLSPIVLTNEVNALIDEVAAAAESPVAAYDALQSLWTFTAEPSEPTAPLATPTPSQQLATANAAALSSLVQQLSVLAAVESATAIDYETADDARTTRDTLIEQLDALADVATDDDLYTALDATRAAIATDLLARAMRLPSLKTITLGEPVPAAVLAWRLYQDPLRADEIVARNSVVDPLAIPAGVPLSVLTV